MSTGYHNNSSTPTQTPARVAAVVVEDGDLRTYRIELPNMLDDLGLSVYAFRLYAHLKRRAGAYGGVCNEGARRMADHCIMSVGKVVAAKRELQAAGLILITPGDPKTSTPDTIRIVDVWAENFSRYRPRASGVSEEGARRRPACRAAPAPARTVNTPVHEAASPCSSGEHPCSPDERKKEPYEERTFEERTHTHRARATAHAAESAGAGVGVCSSKSRFSFEQRKAHAAAHGLGAGWLQRSRSGEYDELIDDALASTAPAAVEQSLRAQPRPSMAYRAALLHLRSILDVNPRLDIAGAVAQLDVSDKDRGRLLTYDFTRKRAAAAGADLQPRNGGGDGVAH